MCTNLLCCLASLFQFWLRGLHTALAIGAIALAAFFAFPAGAATTLLVGGPNAVAVPVGTPLPAQAWNDAFMFLQDALNYARVVINPQNGNDAVTIWVATGLQFADRDSNTPNGVNPPTPVSRARSFEIPRYVSLYAGFNAIEPVNETGFLSRNYQLNPVLLSGDLGTPQVRTDNTYHIVKIDTDLGSVTMDGFIIGGGYSLNEGQDPPSSDFRRASGLVLLGQGMSGGLMVSPKILRCTFVENTAVRGGAVWLQRGQYNSPQFYNCQFISNQAGQLSPPISGNGGAFMVEQFPTEGEEVIGARPVFYNCLFQENFAEDAGGALYIDRHSSPKLYYCTLVRNVALVGAGGVFHLSPFPCGDPGQNDGATSFINSILWNNDCVNCVGTAFDQIQGARGLLDHCNVENLTSIPVCPSEPGNLDSYPLFVDDVPPIFDWRLQCGSPCINTANNGWAGFLQDSASLNLNQLPNPFPAFTLVPDLGRGRRDVGPSGGNYQQTDRGAFEVQSPFGSVCPGEANGVPSICGVDIDDLLVVINNWGPCVTPPVACPGDIFPRPCSDGLVNIDDLVQGVIMNWGCPIGPGACDAPPESVMDCLNTCLQAEDFAECMDKCLEAIGYGP